MSVEDGSGIASRASSSDVLTGAAWQPVTIVSVGGGQDSTALLFRIGLDRAFRATYAPGRVVAIMAATGDEHSETDEHVKALRAFCMRHDIEWQHLTFDRGYHRGSWQRGLKGAYEQNNSIGSQAYPKTCTDNLKVQPIYRFVAEYLAQEIVGGAAARKNSLYLYKARYGKLRVIIGIAAGEEKRIEKVEPKPCKHCSCLGRSRPTDEIAESALTGCKQCKGSGVEPPRSLWMAECVERVYPLVEIGWNRKACQEYIASVGFPVPVPSNCFMCPFKSPDEILWSWLIAPSRFATWETLEHNKRAANSHMNAVANPKTGKIENKNFGVYKLKDLRTVREERLAFYVGLGWSLNQIMAHLANQRVSRGHCVTSTY